MPAMMTNSHGCQITLRCPPSAVKPPSRLAIVMMRPKRMLKRPAPDQVTIHLGNDACTRLTCRSSRQPAQAWQSIFAAGFAPCTRPKVRPRWYRQSQAIRLISRNLVRSLEQTARKPEVARETTYYLAHIGDVKSIDEFLNDDRLFSYAMKAHGLSDMVYAKAFLRKVLTEGITESIELRQPARRYAIPGICRRLQLCHPWARLRPADGGRNVRHR